MNNRNFKDSVFVDLFAKDINAKENFVSLYNALHNTCLDFRTTEVEPVMIEQVLYKSFYNDIAMLIDNKIVILIEHQSTINENMPFRILEYITRIYEKITKSKNKFGRKLIQLPVPEFYVFYNGKEDFPTEKTLKLSDAFVSPEEKHGKTLDFPLEITVKVVNINVDKDNQILKRCEVLEQYSEFVDLVRHFISTGVEDPFKTAIEVAIGSGVLSDYLERKATEVKNMILTEYDYDTDIAVQREEAYEEGLNKGFSQGIAQGVAQGISQGAEQKAVETAKKMLEFGDTKEKISTITGLSLEQVEQLATELSNTATPNA